MNLIRLAASFIVTILFATTSIAAPLDKSANKKIDEAINVHYLATDFKKAAGILKGTIEACGDRCSNAVVARAWMYIGIVRGAGMQDSKGALEAFSEAVTLDPNVALDQDLATDEVIKLFEEAGGDLNAVGGTPETPVEKARPPVDDAPSGGMSCSPDVSEVETRRPVPVSCQTTASVSKLTLYYKEFGSPKWSQVTMAKAGTAWQGTIPCSATGLQGELRWYVIASGGGGSVADSFGSEAEPVQIQLVSSTTEPPPAYPGQSAPARCVDTAECPEDMRGTPSCPDPEGAPQRGDRGWGASCQVHKQCQAGLYCINGSCESPPSCDVGEDCASGVCEDFVCVMSDDDDDGGSSKSGPKNFIGISIGVDFSVLSGEYVCNPNPIVQSTDPAQPGWQPITRPAAFDCYIGSQPYTAAGNSPQSGQFGQSIVPGTIRIALSYERVFADMIGVEGQVGAALLGSPSTGFAQLLHAAVFGKYWFTGTSQGFRPYVALGGGMGQVAAKKNVPVIEPLAAASVDPATNRVIQDPRLVPDTPPLADGSPATWSNYCQTAVFDAQNQPIGCEIYPVTSYRNLGQGFVGVGPGALINLGSFGIDVRVLGKFMLPATGLVIQPTVGVVMGF